MRLEETRAAGRAALVLRPRIANAEQQVAGLRDDFLARRVERRQAETLIEEGEARDALDADRRSQQALDDWFRNRRHTADAQTRPVEPANSYQQEYLMASTPEVPFKSSLE